MFSTKSGTIIAQEILEWKFLRQLNSNTISTGYYKIEKFQRWNTWNEKHESHTMYLQLHQTARQHYNTSHKGFIKIVEILLVGKIYWKTYGTISPDSLSKDVKLANIYYTQQCLLYYLLSSSFIVLYTTSRIIFNKYCCSNVQHYKGLCGTRFSTFLQAVFFFHFGRQIELLRRIAF